MSAVREKQVWILGEATDTEGYVEALHQFPELELTYHGSLARPQLAAAPRAPDLALICSANQHTDAIVKLLTAGTDLWIESPIASNPDDARALAALAELGERTLMSGTPLGHAPIWERARRHVRSGDIGQLRRLDWRMPIKTTAPHVQALEPRELLTALEVFEGFAGPIEALRISWDGDGSGAELCTRHAEQVEGRARFHDRVDASADPALTCRGDAGELWIGSGQCVLHDARGTTRIADGIEAWQGIPAILRNLLARRLGGFIEDRGAWLLQRVTDALLNAERWRPA